MPHFLSVSLVGKSASTPFAQEADYNAARADRAPRAHPDGALRHVYNDGLRSGCIIPLISRHRTLDMLDMASLTDGAFTEDDVELLTYTSDRNRHRGRRCPRVSRSLRLKDKLAQETIYLEEAIRNEMTFDQIVGNSPALRPVVQAVQAVEIVAPRDSAASLLGETGTGEELIARAIHSHSRCKNRTFVKTE